MSNEKKSPITTMSSSSFEFSSVDEFNLYVRQKKLKTIGHSFIDKSIDHIFSFLEKLSCLSNQQKTWLIKVLDFRTFLFAFIIYLVSLSFVKTTFGFIYHGAILIVFYLMSSIPIKNIFTWKFVIGFGCSVVMSFPISLNVFLPAPVIWPLMQFDHEMHFLFIRIPATLGITHIGFVSFLIFIFRVGLSLLSVIFLLNLLSFQNILRAFKLCGVPNIFNQIVVGTISGSYFLLKNGLDIHLAKKSRSICRSAIFNDYAWTASKLAQSWNQSLSMINDLGDAMIARGFGCEPIAKDQFKRLPLKDIIVILTILLLCSGGHFV